MTMERVQGGAGKGLEVGMDVGVDVGWRRGRSKRGRERVAGWERTVYVCMCEHLWHASICGGERAHVRAGTGACI